MNGNLMMYVLGGAGILFILIIVAYICSAKRFLYLYSGVSLFVASLIIDITYKVLFKILVTRHTDEDNIIGLDECLVTSSKAATITCYTPLDSTMT